MGDCCCKSEEEELSEFETYNDVTFAPQQEDIYKTRPHAMYRNQCIRQEQIFRTKPPCWFGHKCSCPCHQGGVCIFKLNTK